MIDRVPLAPSGLAIGWLLVSAGLAMRFGWWVLIVGIGALLLAAGAAKMATDLWGAYQEGETEVKPAPADVYGEALRRTRTRSASRAS